MSDAVQLERLAAGWRAHSPASGDIRFPSAAISDHEAALAESAANPSAVFSAAHNERAQLRVALLPGNPMPRTARFLKAASLDVRADFPSDDKVRLLSHTTTTLCFRQVVLMNDEGLGEDRFSVDGSYASVGAFVAISGLFLGI